MLTHFIHITITKYLVFSHIQRLGCNAKSAKIRDLTETQSVKLPKIVVNKEVAKDCVKNIASTSLCLCRLANHRSTIYKKFKDRF